MIDDIKKNGVIHLIPTPIGENSPKEVIPFFVKNKIENLNHFVVENEKKARRFIKKILPKKNQNDLIIYELNKFSQQDEIDDFLSPCLNGISLGLLSDSGSPCIADPGAKLVSKAHKNNIIVKPLVGPNSILLAMMSSGMNGQNFTFNGYLPINKKERIKALIKFQKIAYGDNYPQLFIETPYRNKTLFDEMINVLENSTRLCIACDLTLNTEFIKTRSISEWKNRKPNLEKRPCIFIIECGF